MPSIKKRAGKTTFGLYAAESRQWRGVIDILKFVELNRDRDDLLLNGCGEQAVKLTAILDRLEKPKKPEPDDEPKGKSK